MAEANGTIESGGNRFYKFYKWCDSTFKLAYFPNNDETTEALQLVNETCGGKLKLIPKKSEDDLLDSLKKRHHIGLVFPDGLKPLKGRSSSSKVSNALLSYTIRVHATAVPTTKYLFPQKLGDPSLTSMSITESTKIIINFT